MKKYQGKTIEEINQDEVIPEEDKSKMIQLLELGVSYPDTRTEEEIWQEKFDALKCHLSLNEKAREHLIKMGGIKVSEVIKINGKEVAIGKWVSHQKSFMKKYQGKTIEEIEQDEEIPKIDKNKMIQLLELGITYPKSKISGQDIGKASYDVSVDECDLAQNELGKLVQKKEEQNTKRGTN